MQLWESPLRCETFHPRSVTSWRPVPLGPGKAEQWDYKPFVQSLTYPDTGESVGPVGSVLGTLTGYGGGLPRVRVMVLETIDFPTADRDMFSLPMALVGWQWPSAWQWAGFALCGLAAIGWPARRPLTKTSRATGNCSINCLRRRSASFAR